MQILGSGILTTGSAHFSLAADIVSGAYLSDAELSVVRPSVCLSIRQPIFKIV